MTKTMLTIAASDPSGGAGVEADIKVAAAHQVFAMSAITAITVQDSSGVRAVHPTDPEAFRRILQLLAGDRPISAIKIGALATADHPYLLRSIRFCVPKLRFIARLRVDRASNRIHSQGLDAFIA